MPNVDFLACFSFACRPCLLPSTFKLATERGGRKKEEEEEEEEEEEGNFLKRKFVSKGISKSRVSPPRLPFPLFPFPLFAGIFFSLFSPAGICRSPSPLPLLLLLAADRLPPFRLPFPSPLPLLLPLLLICRRCEYFAPFSQSLLFFFLLFLLFES